MSGSNIDRINSLNSTLGENEDGAAGIKELQTIIDHLENLELNSKIVIDQSLARGLNYYTGAIIEVTADDVEIGSVCGGGRYDDLTGIFGYQILQVLVFHLVLIASTMLWRRSFYLIIRCKVQLR